MKRFFFIFFLLLPVYAFSQLTETFDGPDITSANAWTGDLDYFAIEDGWLVSHADPDGSAIQLQIPITYASSMSWEFEVSMDEKPTDPNHINVYLFEDDKTRTGSIYDYYVQVGSNKNTLTLRKLINSNTNKILIADTLDVLSDAMTIRVKVTLANRNTWSLYVLEDDNFVLLGTVESAVSSQCQSGDLTLECRYTKTRVDSFAFNEIIVTHEASDESEETEDDSEEDQEDTEETTVTSYSASSVRINEVMANPNGLTDFPETEYVELYNTTDEEIDLYNWTFVYKTKEVVLPSFTLEGESFVVLYRSSRDIYVDSSGQALALEKFPSALVNTGAYLALWDPTGNVIDEVTYEEATAGVSWERYEDGDGFYLSTDSRGGTPGSANSLSEESEETDEDTEEDTDGIEEVDDSEEDQEETKETTVTSYSVGSVRINEVMANPNGLTDFPETEYVELYNTTDEEIDLYNWTFVYKTKEVVLPSFTLEGESYVVLYRSSRDIYVDSSGQALALEKFPSALLNTGAYLALWDPTGNVIDEVTYEEATAGVSWERYEDGDGFYLSTDSRGGTPGSANSLSEESEETDEDTDTSTTYSYTTVSANEIVFNEILPNPYTDGSEYIELYNRSNRTLPLSGLSIAKRGTSGELSTHYSLSSITTALESGGYALLTKDVEGVEAFYSTPSSNVLHEVKLPVLANTSATLVLFRTDDETVIDEVCYTSDWHASTIKDEKGVSLERIDPDGETQDDSNWTSASSLEGYGTPGYQNSQYEKAAEGETTGIEAPVYSELTQTYSISYLLDQAGYTCRAWVYDISGRQVCQLLNLTITGVEGSLTWDGRSSKGSKLRAGVYVFYAELTHPKGSTQRYKKAFLVH